MGLRDPGGFALFRRVGEARAVRRLGAAAGDRVVDFGDDVPPEEIARRTEEGELALLGARGVAVRPEAGDCLAGDRGDALVARGEGAAVEGRERGVGSARVAAGDGEARLVDQPGGRRDPGPLEPIDPRDLARDRVGPRPRPRPIDRERRAGFEDALPRRDEEAAPPTEDTSLGARRVEEAIDRRQLELDDARVGLGLRDGASRHLRHELR